MIFKGLIARADSFTALELGGRPLSNVDVYAWDGFVGTPVGNIVSSRLSQNGDLHITAHCRELIPVRCTHMCLYYQLNAHTGEVVSLRCDIVPLDWEGRDPIYEIQYKVESKNQLNWNK